MKGNPWDLPPRQAQCVQLLADIGCNKLIARHMGIDHRTVEEHLRRAFKRMDVPNRIVGAIQWDRWMREVRSVQHVEEQQ
jgi:DNA-binding CsgD family transcriptional regulator